MIDVNQLRRGITFLHDNNLYRVLEYSHNKPGRGKATIRVTVRNVRTGANLQITFTSGDRVEDIRIEKRAMQYLYDDGTFYVFMDVATYEQVLVTHALLEDHKNYLKESMELELLFYDTEVVDYALPQTMDLLVVESENAVAGDTASGATKEVITETGLRVRTPLFVNTGDTIRVNTTEGTYSTRV
ncbi:MAG: elongation factor P [Chloroflexi bacterium]|nr:elongation factor P [Chloroflexota bacterium]